MGVLAVDGDANDLCANRAKLFDAVAKGDDLCRTDKGKVERVEQEDLKLAEKVVRGEGLDLPADDGLARPERGALLD